MNSLIITDYKGRIRVPSQWGSACPAPFVLHYYYSSGVGNEPSFMSVANICTGTALKRGIISNVTNETEILFPEIG